jgi:glutamate dehydrogenase (NADP+)
VIRELRERLLDGVDHPTVAVQGFGNAGAQLAHVLAEDGYRVVAVSDSSAAIHDPDGLDVDVLRRHKTDTGSLADAPVGEPLEDQNDLLTLEVDLLVPAALEGAIHADNASDVRARVIVEVANGPVTADADGILDDLGVTIVPDILANAGGVTVSWFEWIQNRSGDAWPVERVRGRLEERMVRETRHVQELADDRKVPLRTAAYVVALERIAAAMEATGTAALFSDGDH